MNFSTLTMQNGANPAGKVFNYPANNIYANYAQTAACNAHGSTACACDTTGDAFVKSPCATAVLAPPKKNMQMIAHRGYSKVAPENTLPAFVAAAKNGFTTVECDIQWTKDGVPVILHDSTINRTARYFDGGKISQKKKVSDVEYNELLNYDFGVWKNAKYKGTKIPTFSEFTDCCSKNNLKAYIELKNTSDFNGEKAIKLAEAVKEAGLEDKVTWISFDANYLKTMSKLLPNSRIGYLTWSKPNEKTVATLKSLKTETNEVFLNARAGAMDKTSSDLLKNSGFNFEAWTVDKKKDLHKLQSCNCTGVTTKSLLDCVA